MRCPNCKEEIEQGFLYCQKCGYEIQIVPDYNPIVEDVLSGSLKDMAKEIHSEEKKSSKQGTSVKKPVYENNRISKRKIFFAFLLIVLVTGVFLSVYLNSKRKNSYEYQYEQAVLMFDKKEYGKAQEYLDRAMELKKDQLSAWMLRMRIAETISDVQMTEDCYEYILSGLDPSNQEIYIKLVELYITQNDMDKVKEMLSSCTVPSVLNYFKDYIAEVPVSSFPEGLYYDTIQVDLNAGDNDIYFTLDGSKPTVNSTKYEGTILLDQGITTIRAIAVSKAGIQSDEAIFNYEIAHLESEMPEVSPVSGQYPQRLEIVVQVPDGCTVLYTLDGSVPTLDSKVYTEPVIVTQSVVFTAVSVSMSGHISDTVVRNYVITP